MSDPSRQDVWKMFDLISPTYDRVNRILSLGMDQKWRKKVVKHLPIKKNLKILDLATGTGDQIIALLQKKGSRGSCKTHSPVKIALLKPFASIRKQLQNHRFFQAKQFCNCLSIQSITGIDLSSEMLAIAKEKLQNQATLIQADAENLPFANNHFDAATFSFGIRNVSNPLSALKSIHRVLKPKGRCLILEFSLPPQPIRFFYLFYLRYILPNVGGLLSKNLAAYRYLNQTIEHFPSGKAFGSLMKEAGFVQLSAIPMALGGVTLYIGEKG